MRSFFQEVRTLQRAYSGNIPEKVRASIADAKRAENVISTRLDLQMEGLDILEIGPGQFLSQTTYFALRNRVTAIDLEVICKGGNPFRYFQMARANGFRRTAKTLGRKLLGIDRQYAAELSRQLNVADVPDLNVLQMDACNLTFDTDSFDLVYARSVFHHLPDPGAALDGIVRVLRPGGGLYILLHLYTSDTGCLDPRIYTDRRDEVRGWLHLRQSKQNGLNNRGTVVNKLRLADWRALFEKKIPGVQILTTRSDSATIEAAESLQRCGELSDYSLEELTTTDLAVLWRKSSADSLPSSTQKSHSQLVAAS